ncbi:MAG: TMEM175 family protein, partial [Propionicimonas sp.]
MRNGDRPVRVERLVFFTDAAVAIAMTLLVLPLMEGVSEAGAAGDNAVGYLSANADALFGFVLSFVIVARFWRAHHRLFEHVEYDVAGVFWLNMGWLLAIVFLPVATAMTAVFAEGAAQYLVYIATILACSLGLTAMVLVYR